MERLLHLIRHGQASAGSANYDRLSPLGRDQARMLGRWWKSSGFDVDAAWHGTLARQRDSASIALEAASLSPPLTILPELNEYDHRAVDGHLGKLPGSVEPSVLEGPAPVNPESMSYTDYALTMRRWRDTTDLPDSIEHWHAFAARGWQAIRSAADASGEARSLAFFTSGGVISTVMATVLDLDFEHTIDAIWRVRNASITTFAWNGTNARLVEFNSVTHLEIEREPALVTLI